VVDHPLYSSDPITELLERLDDGTLTLAWSVRWGRGGATEPLAGAWAASAQPQDMLTLLLGAGRTEDARRVALEVDPDNLCRVCFEAVSSFDGEVTERSAEPTYRDCPPCAADVRRVVPVAPILAELLEARRVG
jgi:hypothetical protein